MLPEDGLIGFGLAATTAVLFSFLSYRAVRDSCRPKANLRRESLPCDLWAWKKLVMQEYLQSWEALDPLLRPNGLRLWECNGGAYCPPDNDLTNPDNYVFLGNKAWLATPINNHVAFSAVSHPARSDDSRDFILRVMTVGGQGHNHLQIMRELSSLPDIFLNNNHVLPMVKEIVFQDITIGVFPRVMRQLLHSIRQEGRSDKNSVEDILYMMVQAFEGITFIHSKRIAHCDLFLDNFMVEWFPESLTRPNGWPRPRVYLIDFETAVQFPEESLPSDRVINGYPLPENIYGRPKAPEMSDTAPYCPFRLDIWQFALLSDYYLDIGFVELDELWSDMLSSNPEERPTALEAMERLNDMLLEYRPGTTGYLHIETRTASTSLQASSFVADAIDHPKGAIYGNPL